MSAMTIWAYRRSPEQRAADRAMRRRMEMADELGRAEHLVLHLVAETTDEYLRDLARDWLARAEARRRRIQRIIRGDHSEREDCGGVDGVSKQGGGR